MTAHDPALVGLVAEALDRFTHVDLAVPFARGNVARAVLDAITTSPRHVLVELPEARPGWFYTFPEEDETSDHLVFGDDDCAYVVTHWPADGPHVQISYQGEPIEPLSAGEAKRLGAALIAAVRHAESTATEQD